MNSEYERYKRALRCPIDPTGARFGEFAAVLHECWVTLLYENLPDDAHAAPLTNWEWGVKGTVEDEDIDDHHYDSDEVARFADAIISNRKDLAPLTRMVDTPRTIGPDSVHVSVPKPPCGMWLDETFERMAGWTMRLKIIGSSARAKHHASSDSTWDELKRASVGKEFNGSQLLPTFGSDELFRACMDGLGMLFQLRIREFTDDWPGGDGRRAHFLRCWEELFAPSFRFMVGYECIVGASGGAEARWMIFDLNMPSGAVHCYPSRGPTFDAMPSIIAESPNHLLEGSRRFFASAVTKL